MSGLSLIGALFLALSVGAAIGLLAGGLCRAAREN